MLTRPVGAWQLTAQFAKEYEEKTGIAVKFRLSFGGSGTQARAVVDGLPGDMGNSLCPHPFFLPLLLVLLVYLLWITYDGVRLLILVTCTIWPQMLKCDVMSTMKGSVEKFIQR